MDPNKIFRQKALEKLQSPDRLDELMTVTASSAWVALAAVAVLLAALIGWACVGSIQLRAGGDGVLVGGSDGLEAVVYVALADGPRIQPGMAAALAPLSVPREQYGLLRGTVSAVDSLPSSSARMLEQARNDALVQSWIARGNLVAVRVRLTPDRAAASGYAWSMGSGPPAPLRDGTPVAGSIVVSEQRPIALLLP